MVRLDLLYIENWSVGYDVALMMRTVPAVLSPEGAY
jgi:lipopolysaccharide/colanic/teichoic acid biosynthesis glycosyltransferase